MIWSGFLNGMRNVGFHVISFTSLMSEHISNKLFDDKQTRLHGKIEKIIELVLVVRAMVPNGVELRNFSEIRSNKITNGDKVMI